MSTATNLADTERLAIPAAEVAKLLGISERHLWSLQSSGRLPRPLSFGRSKRWNRAELEAWLDAGAPDRSTWESMCKKSRVLPQPGA